MKCSGTLKTMDNYHTAEKITDIDITSGKIRRKQLTKVTGLYYTKQLHKLYIYLSSEARYQVGPLGIARASHHNSTVVFGCVVID